MNEQEKREVKEIERLLERAKQKAIKKSEYHFAVILREIQEHIYRSNIGSELQSKNNYKTIEVDLPEDIVDLVKAMENEKEAAQELTQILLDKKTRNIEIMKSFWGQIKIKYVDPLNLGIGFNEPALQVKIAERKLVIKYFGKEDE